MYHIWQNVCATFGSVKIIREVINIDFMRFINFSVRVLLLSFCIVVISNTIIVAGAPGCPECAGIDPNDDTAYELCVALNDCSDGVDIPVNGNMWVLALAGFVFAFVKFGGHTKLAGYYYSKEKQE